MIEKLLTADKTVFRTQEIANILAVPVDKRLWARIQYYVARGKLIRLSKGIYALSLAYDRLELGNALRRPSYVSLYTVLQQEGVIFQSYQPLYFVADRSETVTIHGQEFVYRKIKDDILAHPLGIHFGANLASASIERAIADKIYLDGNEYFDNLRSIDWERMKQLNRLVYRSARLDKFIEKNHA